MVLCAACWSKASYTLVTAPLQAALLRRMRGAQRSVQIWGTGVRVEVVLRTLGLANAADTMVGSATVRGVSGGERKRVTSAEMLVGPKVRCQLELMQTP